MMFVVSPFLLLLVCFMGLVRLLSLTASSGRALFTFYRISGATFARLSYLEPRIYQFLSRNYFQKTPLTILTITIGEGSYWGRGGSFGVGNRETGS